MSMSLSSEQYIRFGFYVGAAGLWLGDSSYEKRWRGKVEELTEELYWEIVSEIQQRLVAAGKCRADEDIFETSLSEAT